MRWIITRGLGSVLDLPGRIAFDLPVHLYERYQWVLIRPLVILLAWALCLGIGAIIVLLEVETLVLVIAGVGAAVAALITLWRVQVGLILAIVVSLWVRFSLTTGTQSPLVASLLFAIMLVGVWVVRMLLFDKHVSLAPSRINYLLLLFGAVAVLSFVWSNAFPDPTLIANQYWEWTFNMRLGTLMVVLASVGVALIASSQLHDERLLKLIVVIFVVAGTLGTFRLLNYGLGINLPLHNIPIISDLNDGGLFRMWVTALLLSQALFNRQMSVWPRLFLGGVTAMLFDSSFFIGGTWLTGWSTSLVAILVIVLLRSRKLFLLLVVVMLVLALANSATLEEMLLAEREESGETRLQAWNTSLMMTNGHWFLGTGPGGYAAYYMTYIPTEAMATHSNYLDVLAQFGIVGLVTIIALLVSVMWKGFQVYRSAPEGGFLSALAVGLLAGIVAATFAMALGDWVLPFPYTQTIAGFSYTVWTWLFMGTIVAVDRLLARKGL